MQDKIIKLYPISVIAILIILCYFRWTDDAHSHHHHKGPINDQKLNTIPVDSIDKIIHIDTSHFFLMKNGSIQPFK